MESYDYECIYDYENSCHDYLDERVHIHDDLDEDRPREHTDFQELAYLHYAWCTSTHIVLTQCTYDTLDAMMYYTAHFAW